MNYRLYVMLLNDLVYGTNPSRTSFSLQGLLGPSTTMEFVIGNSFYVMLIKSREVTSF